MRQGYLPSAENIVDGRGFTGNIRRLTLVIEINLVIETKIRNYGS